MLGFREAQGIRVVDGDEGGDGGLVPPEDGEGLPLGRPQGWAGRRGDKYPSEWNSEGFILVEKINENANSDQHNVPEKDLRNY